MFIMERTSGGFLSLYLFIKAYAEILTRHPIALLLISCSLLLGYLVWKATTSELRSLPGPFLARFSIYYRFWLVSTGRGPIKYLELHEKYGSVVRTGPNHVSLSDPSMISILYDMKNTFLKVGQSDILTEFVTEFANNRVNSMTFSNLFTKELQWTLFLQLKIQSLKKA